MNQHTQAPASLRLSIVVPTFGRPDCVVALLGHLRHQTAAMDSFEVIFVDDGGKPPVEIETAAQPFECAVVRQGKGGPAMARNSGILAATAPLLLILNDDAVPAHDLVESHLRAHEELGPGHAVLGTFRFTESSLQSPFVRTIQDSNLLFAFESLRDGMECTWDFFWTCNISLARMAVVDVGGFDDARFDRAICEDVELGLRLCQTGMKIIYREDCVAEHEHRFTAREYMARAFQLGRFQYRLGLKYGKPGLLFPAALLDGNGQLSSLYRGDLEARRLGAASALEALEELEVEYDGKQMPQEMMEDTKSALMLHSQFHRFAGLGFELTGEDLRGAESPERATKLAAGPAAEPLALSLTPRITEGPASEGPASEDSASEDSASKVASGVTVRHANQEPASGAGTSEEPTLDKLFRTRSSGPRSGRAISA